MSGRRLAWITLALALVGALGTWFWLSYTWVEEEVVLPSRGAARYNPLYGLGLTLQDMGFEVLPRATLDLDAMQLAPGEVLLLATEIDALGQRQSDALRSWVERGGHLVFALPSSVSGDDAPLLAGFGLSVTRDWQCVRWDAPGLEEPGRLCAPATLDPFGDDVAADAWDEAWDDAAEDAGADGGEDGFDAAPAKSFARAAGDPPAVAHDAPAAPEADEAAARAVAATGNDASPDVAAAPRFESTAWRWPAGEGYMAARSRWGEGSWLVLPHFRFLRGRALDEPEHVALAWALLQPLLSDTRVHIVYATDLPPAHVLLLRYGWPVWMPLLLALLAWLWRRSQRLGPVLPLPAPDRRALMEHLGAAGEFAFRRGRAAALHRALLHRFEARLQREFPAVAALAPDDRIDAIARTWSIDPALVRQALAPADLRSPEVVLTSFRSLFRLQTPP